MITPCAPCRYCDEGFQRGPLPQLPCRPDGIRDGLERISGRTPLRGVTRSPIMSPDAGPRTEIRLGTRARLSPIDSYNASIAGGQLLT